MVAPERHEISRIEVIGGPLALDTPRRRPHGPHVAFCVEHMDVVTEAGPGQLAKYSEQRGGALKAMIERYGIQVLDRPAWEAKKTELGAVIYR